MALPSLSDDLVHCNKEEAALYCAVRSRAVVFSALQWRSALCFIEKVFNNDSDNDNDSHNESDYNGRTGLTLPSSFLAA